MARLFGINWLQGNRINPFILELKFETNDDGAPQGVSPDHGDDLKVERTAAGTYTITFRENKKPWHASVFVGHEMDDADLKVTTDGYDHDDGTIKVYTYTNDGGTWTKGDTDGDRLVVLVYATRSSEGNRLAASEDTGA